VLNARKIAESARSQLAPKGAKISRSVDKKGRAVLWFAPCTARGATPDLAWVEVSPTAA